MPKLRNIRLCLNVPEYIHIFTFICTFIKQKVLRSVKAFLNFPPLCMYFFLSWYSAHILLCKCNLSQQLVQFLKQHVCRQYKGEKCNYFALLKNCMQVSLCLVPYMQHLGGKWAILLLCCLQMFYYPSPFSGSSFALPLTKLHSSLNKMAADKP